MMFCQATLREARYLLAIVQDFMNASGTQINKDKSDIFLFNTATQSQAFLEIIMGFRIGTLPSKYLGIPLSLNPLGVEKWNVLLDWIQGRLQNWTIRALNMANRVTLLKAVLQSIPIYQLLGLETPKILCNDLKNIFKNFLWKGTQTTKK